jgi:hypothetical protein
MSLGENDSKNTKLEYGSKRRDDHSSARIPDDHREKRLRELREEATLHGTVRADAAPIEGAPFPKASLTTGYYGIPMQKAPQWTWEVPLYLFVGGAGGAAAVIAEAARLTGTDENNKLIRDARTIAAVGALMSPGLLVLDLGRPKRFINMMRVFKPQSAMSVGVYILSAWSPNAFVTKINDFLLHRFDTVPMRFLQEFTSTASGAFGIGMATYTGVLLGATAIPVWNHHVRSLPVHFSMSGTSAAVGLLELMGNDRPALNIIGLGTAMMETAEGLNTERLSADDISSPLRRGISGAICRLGGVLAGPIPLMLRTAALFTSKKRSMDLRRFAAACCVAGSLATRVGWIYAGHASAKDWRIPLQIAPSQREMPDKSQPPYAKKQPLASAAAD